MLLSTRNLVMLSLYLMAVLLSFSCQQIHADEATSPAQTGHVQSGSTSLTTLSPVDDANGDDGAAIKEDLKKLDVQKPVNQTESPNHHFYRPEYITNATRAMSFWVDFSKIPLSQNATTKHKMLSDSHRRAAPIKLSFEFPFYGQPLKNIIIATGGFLYLGDHLHHWLAATQNISPLMANFDLSLSNSSDIHFHDDGSMLVVQWQNVQMKDNKPPGNFSFQVTLHKNGDIVFVYKSLPVPINEIPEDEHPVKVGISDAFLIDKVAYFIRRKTIYDYHRINLKEISEIKSQTAIYLKALPTCNQYDTCQTCSKAAPDIDCIWCPAVKRCSSGYDRKRQEWLTNECDKLTKSDCSVKSEVAGPTQDSNGSNQLISVDSPSSARQKMNPDRMPDQRSGEGGATFVTLLMFLGLSSGICLWVFYAYKNPHTPSGQLLIKYRPSNWRWQNSETRYTAASIHM